MLTRHSFPRHAQRVTNSQSHSPIWIAIGIDERTHENVWSCCEIFIKLQVGFSPQRAKFSKISCVDTAPGEPPAFPLVPPLAHAPRAPVPAATSDNHGPAGDGRSDSFSISVFRLRAMHRGNYFRRGCGFCSVKDWIRVADAAVRRSHRIHGDIELPAKLEALPKS